MTARTLMIQGTSSSVGKSLLVTALCRIFARRGLRVAPFKAQNMSNNAAVCADGAEIGRSQALQALAAGVEPVAEMNPILLKPEGNMRSQVIVMGRPWRTLAAGAYSQHKAAHWATVTTALEHLRARYDLVLIEGAGSPVELNLQAGDIVNMAVAQYAKAPVLLVGDIDRGGVFAQILGTLWLLSPEERALVRGLLVNKFRGEAALFADGVRILEARSALPILGVVPFFSDLHLPEEDAAVLDEPFSLHNASATSIDIAVIRLPCIANFDDFSPLAAEPGVRLRYVTSCATLQQPHAIILPGTKSTMADLQWLRQQGFEPVIKARAAAGTSVVGLCGGYQMLGQSIHDPHGVESSAQSMQGLGLLPVHTVFEQTKATYQAAADILGGPGWLAALQGQTLEGYEIHLGQTPSVQPWLALRRHGAAPSAMYDGARSATGQVWGCYLHGLFANTVFRRAWLASLGWHIVAEDGVAPRGLQDTLDALAWQVETHLDMAYLEATIWEKSPQQ